jgi:hypothetical protein
MSGQVDMQLVEDTVDAYVGWREECGWVWDAYDRWSGAPVAHRPFAFSAYLVALDCEEHAARIYACRAIRLAAAMDGPSGIGQTALRMLRIAGDLSPAFARLFGSAN